VPSGALTDIRVLMQQLRWTEDCSALLFRVCTAERWCLEHADVSGLRLQLTFQDKVLLRLFLALLEFFDEDSVGQ